MQRFFPGKITKVLSEAEIAAQIEREEKTRLLQFKQAADDLAGLRELAGELNIQIYQQAPTVAKIEENTQQAAKNVTTGTQELKKAEELAKQSSPPKEPEAGCCGCLRFGRR